MDATGMKAMPQARLIGRDDRSPEIFLKDVANANATKAGAGNQYAICVAVAVVAHLSVQGLSSCSKPIPAG